MKCVILAGGFGSRLSEYTKIIPKPMVTIRNIPILIHIMEHYSNFGINNFYIATGYKKDIIEKYFSSISKKKIFVGKNQIKFSEFNKKKHKSWIVNTVYTGLKTMTGGRLKKVCKKFSKNEIFFMTYGDGVCSIDINKLLNFHNSHNKIATITAVHPPARFGELKINKKFIVEDFKEKPQTKSSWINGGFFIFRKEIEDYILSSNTVLENEPLEKLSKNRQLIAFKHDGFWQPMDTKRDKDFLEKVYKNNNQSWPQKKLI